MFNAPSIKGMAKALRDALTRQKIDLSHSQCLELIAKQFGLKDWNTLAAAVGPEGTEKPLFVTVVADEVKLDSTIQQLNVNDANLSGSIFNDANLSGSKFTDINFSGARFNNINMSGWQVFDVNLSGSRVENANLSGMQISDCHLAGATLEGQPLEAMLELYQRSQNA